MAVPADSSCLFTSVYYVVEGECLNPACAPEMRRLIAQIVASDPDFYSEAILGKTNESTVTGSKGMILGRLLSYPFV